MLYCTRNVELSGILAGSEGSKWILEMVVLGSICEFQVPKAGRGQYSKVQARPTLRVCPGAPNNQFSSLLMCLWLSEMLEETCLSQDLLTSVVLSAKSCA